MRRSQDVYRDRVTLPTSLRRTAAVAALGACVLLLAACTPTISVPVAAHATEPLCASAVLAAPTVLADQPQARTNSQATAAWGDAGAAITLRCGVEPPQAASEDCVAVTDAAGKEYDWIAARTTTGWRFTSYGRSPALEVELPATLGLSQPTAPLADLAASLSVLPQAKTCQ